MHIRTIRNNRGHRYYQLVESYRQDGKVKKRILLSLGRVEDNQIDNLSDAIARHKNQLAAIGKASSVNIQDTFVLGPLLVLEKLFDRLGINQVLSHIQKAHPKLGFDLKTHVFSMVSSRFVRPGSKLKIYDHLLGKLYPGLIAHNIKLHTLYRSITLLARHKDEIEKRLYQHGRDLLDMPVDVVLYDLTTLRFESVRTDLGRLRQFGYSKEMRSDCTQVILGLLLDINGLPLGFEVYPGNTFEGHTLKSIVQKMRQKFQIRRFIFVADRGLFSEANLDFIRQDGGEFIVGMRLGLIKDRPELYDLSRFQGSLEDDLRVHETQHRQDRLILSWSRLRYDRDQKTRGDILEKIMKKLGSKHTTPRSFISHAGWKRYVRLEGEGRAVLNEEAIREDERKDGFFGILTNVKDLSAGEILKQYKNLWKIEDAFGEIKGPTLKARPVFHWSDERIIGHLCLCFLAYLCEAHLTESLRRKGEMLESPSIRDGVIRKRPLTVSEAMKELNEVRAVPVQFGSKNTIWVRTDITGNAARLLEAAGIKHPPKILGQGEKCGTTAPSGSCFSEGK